MNANTIPTLARDLSTTSVGIPANVERPQLSPDPGAKTVSYFRSYTVASWIRLQHPDSRVATYPVGPPVKTDGGAEVIANVTRLEDKQFPRLLLEYESRPNCNPD